MISSAIPRIMDRVHGRLYKIRFMLPGLALALLTVLAVVLTRPSPQAAGAAPAAPTNTGTVAVEGEVLTILEEGTVELGPGRTQPYQVVRVRLLTGEWAGEEFTVDYGRQQMRPLDIRLRPGDRLILQTGRRPDGVHAVYFVDFQRTGPLLWLGLTFVIFIVLVSGWKGIRGLLGTGVSLVVITSLIIPRILRGDDPVIVSVTGAFVLLAVTMYLIYGWTLKAHVAALGTLIALIITGLLAALFVNLTRLTGYGTEEAIYLMQQVGGVINLRGLVLGGIIIGALGVLDDLTTSQVAAVFELYITDPDIPLRTLYGRAMEIGKDHMTATINTLVLAYAGAALPLLMLFWLSGETFARLANLEFLTEEIVRTLVGSLGLMAAVPITTMLASLVVVYHDYLSPLRQYLGPATLEHGGCMR